MRGCCETPRKRGDAGADTAPGGLYRPRNPQASPLWQCAKRHAKELREAGRLRRAVEEQAIERFIECGELVPRQVVYEGLSGSARSGAVGEAQR